MSAILDGQTLSLRSRTLPTESGVFPRKTGDFAHEPEPLQLFEDEVRGVSDQSETSQTSQTSLRRL